jgi:putative copper resistance protein D
MLDAGLIVSRFVHYVAVLALFGGALFPLYAGDSVDPTPTPWNRRWLAAAAVLAFASGIAWFFLTTASMAGDPSSAFDASALMTVITSTDFGPLWLVRMALILATLWLTAASPRRAPRWTAPLVAGLALAALAGTGHARVPDGWRGIVHVAADGAHLLAAGIWLGGLWPLGLALAGSARTAGTDDDVPVGLLLSRFSGVGYLAVGTLVLTGAISAWLLVGSLGQLIGSSYGRMLLAKVAIFLAMVGLAVANRFWVTPALMSGRSAGDARWIGRVRRHVLLEQALGIGIIAIVSVLGTTEPPRMV